MLHVHRIKDAAILDHSVLVVAGREVHMPRAREVPGYRHVVATRGGRCRLIDRAAVHDLVLFGTSICHGGTHGVRAEEHTGTVTSSQRAAAGAGRSTARPYMISYYLVRASVTAARMTPSPGLPVTPLSGSGVNSWYRIVPLFLVPWFAYFGV